MLGAPPTPAAVQPTKPDTSGASTSGTTPPASNSTTRNMRPSNKLDYKDLNTGWSQFGREQFRKRCSRAGSSVRKSVAKVRKMSLAELFLSISQNSSSSSTAFSKWAKAKCFRIRIQSWSTWRASTTRNPNYTSKILDDMWLPLQTFMSGLSTSPRFWTPNTQSNKTTTYCWTNMKSLLKQLPRLPLMSTSSRSLSALGIFKMSSNYQNLSTGTTNNLWALRSPLSHELLQCLQDHRAPFRDSEDTGDTSGPWIMWSRQTNAKQLRSRRRPWIGPKNWLNSSAGPTLWVSIPPFRA